MQPSRTHHHPAPRYGTCAEAEALARVCTLLNGEVGPGVCVQFVSNLSTCIVKVCMYTHTYSSGIFPVLDEVFVCSSYASCSEGIYVYTDKE